MTKTWYWTVLNLPFYSVFKIMRANLRYKIVVIGLISVLSCKVGGTLTQSGKGHLLLPESDLVESQEDLWSCLSKCLQELY